MIARLVLVVLALTAGIAAASLSPGLSQGVRHAIGWLPGASQFRKDAATASEQRPRSAEPREEKQGRVKISDDQIAAARIEIAAAEGGTVSRHLLVPGTIVPDANRVARVAVKLSATVAELRKGLGDEVVKDEVVAVLESREVADAKSEYFAARLASELQQTLSERDKILWDKRISTEQQFLRSRNAAAETRMRLDIARQKLLALGLSEQEIGNLHNEPETSLRRQEVRAPRGGRIVERKVDLGAAVGRDNLETELFVIMDLSRVWVELAVSPDDLPAVQEGQTVTLMQRGGAEKQNGRITFISPLLEKETRSARVIGELGNENGIWRPGMFVSCEIKIEEQPVPLAVPATALHTIETEQVVFVRTADGFEKRPVKLGRRNGAVAEVLSDLEPGEKLAITNTFTLKAELLKAQAED